MPGSDRGTLLVTGGNGEIGSAIALRAGAAGYAVCVNYGRDQTAAERVVAEIRLGGGKALAYRADVTSAKDVADMFDAAMETLGPLTGLVNNAGIIGGKARVDEVSAQTLRDVFAVNVVGAFLCAGEAVRRMSTPRGGRGGAIVNISSRAASLGSPGEWVHYAASKGALDSLTVGLAREVAGEGIRVNSVNPGLIDTRIHSRAGDPDRLRKLAQTVPLGRPGTVDDVAHAVLFLLSDAAAYITGAKLDVSGGR